MLEVTTMTYRFTITDSFNSPVEEIFKQASEVASEEIIAQELDSNLVPKQIGFKEEEGKKIYKFSLVTPDELHNDEDTSKKAKSTRRTDGLAASP